MKQATIYGAVVADEIDVEGSAVIHYDKALSTNGDYISGSSVEMLSWIE